MWKAQHPGGQREINELHVPAGQDVRLVHGVAGRDPQLLHARRCASSRTSFPGRYETMWFRADKPGRYHLFCAEYCGTDHAHMGGWLTVMEPRAISPAGCSDQGGQETLAAQGEPTCSAAMAAAAATSRGGTVRAPQLEGVFGSPVPLVGRQRGRRRRTLCPQFDPRPEGSRSRPAMRPSCRPSPGRSARTISPSLVAYIESIGTQPTGGRALMPAPHQPELSEREDRHPLVAADDRPQAHRIALFRVDHLLLRDRRDGRDADPARADHAAGRPWQRRLLQPPVHHARRRSWCGSSSSRRSRRRWAISSSR